MSRVTPRKLVRYLAVGTFVVLTGVLGALIASFVVWIFTLGLLPAIATYVVSAAAGAVAGYWGYQHTQDYGWTEEES